MLNYCHPFERRIFLCGGGGEEGVVFRDTLFSKYPRQVWKCGSSCFFPLISLIFWIYWVGQKVCFENPNELFGQPSISTLSHRSNGYGQPQEISVFVLGVAFRGGWDKEIKSWSLKGKENMNYIVYGLYSQWNSPSQNTGVGSCSLLHGIFPTQESNLGLPALQADSLPAEPPGKPKNTEVSSLSLLQGIFPAQELNWGLLHCRWIFFFFYQLSYQGIPQERKSWSLKGEEKPKPKAFFTG